MKISHLVSHLAAVHIQDLENIEAFNSLGESFDCVSYGDASYTLVHPGDLIDELKEKKDERLAPLIEELISISMHPSKPLIALNG